MSQLNIVIAINKSVSELRLLPIAQDETFIMQKTVKKAVVYTKWRTLLNLHYNPVLLTIIYYQVITTQNQ